ncbi:MAG: ankyrin repeat domain-containing protein [Fimbriimonas sp.]|nr:ankyrin repeat domain-containing protein [Fimbriimonas sp.]
MEDAYEQLDPQNLFIEARFDLKAIKLDTDGSVAKLKSINGKVTWLKVEGHPVDLLTAELSEHGGRAVISTKECGPVEVSFDPNQQATFWLKPSQLLSLKDLLTIQDWAFHGDLGRVEAMVKNNPNLVRNKDEKGMTPLSRGVEGDHLDVVNFLLSCHPNPTLDSDILASAATDASVAVVESLLTHGAPVNGREKDGSTALHDASFNGKKEVVSLLLANHAEVNARDKSGKTPLSLAISNKQLEIADILRLHGGHI